MRFSEQFGLDFSQAELDFVDIRLDTDTPLFLDPLALGIIGADWAESGACLVIDFFQRVLDALVEGDRAKAKRLMEPLREDNRTRLGYSQNRSHGRGLGDDRAAPFLEAMEQSDAFRSGHIQDLETAALLVEGVGLDIVSDMITNVIHERLVVYTHDQCRLYSVPLAKHDRLWAWQPRAGLSRSNGTQRYA